MRAFALLALLSLAGLPGQDGPPVHRAHARLEPWRAFEHLSEGGRRRVAAGPDALLVPAPRPTGGGRWIAAVVTCADLDLVPAQRFAQRPRDLLHLRSPGPRLSAADLALLERAVRDQRLSLCVVLTHEDCPSLEAPGRHATDAERALANSTAMARERAAREHIPVAEAQALLLKEALLAGSTLLREQATIRGLAVVPGIVDGRTAGVRWITTPAERLSMPPVRAR